MRYILDFISIILDRTEIYHLLYLLCMVSSKHLYWFSLVLVSFISFSISFLLFFLLTLISMHYMFNTQNKVKYKVWLIYWTTDEAEPQQIKYLQFLLKFSPSLTRCIFPITTNIFISESSRWCINLLLQRSSPNLLDKIGFWASLSFSLEICHFFPKIGNIFWFIVKFLEHFCMYFITDCKDYFIIPMF